MLFPKGSLGLFTDRKSMADKCFCYIITNMEKLMGIILLAAAVVVSYYLVTNMDRLTSIKIPIPESIVKYFKIQPFQQQ